MKIQQSNKNPTIDFGIQHLCNKWKKNRLLCSLWWKRYQSIIREFGSIERWHVLYFHIMKIYTMKNVMYVVYDDGIVYLRKESTVNIELKLNNLLPIKEQTTVAIFCTHSVLCFHIKKGIVQSKNGQWSMNTTCNALNTSVLQCTHYTVVYPNMVPM